MSKKTENDDLMVEEAAVDIGTQTPASELLEKGEVMLIADSRPEIDKQGEDLVSSLPQGTNWMCKLARLNPETQKFNQLYYLTK